MNIIGSTKSLEELWGDWQQNGDLLEADRQRLWEFLRDHGIQVWIKQSEIDKFHNRDRPLSVVEKVQQDIANTIVN